MHAFKMIVKKLKYFFNYLVYSRQQVCKVQEERSLMPFYFEPNLRDGATSNNIMLHRMLLWDDCEPIYLMKYINSVRKKMPEINHIMWNRHMVVKLIKDLHIDYYFDYPHKIMQADLARYLVLYHYGGIYFDLDISMHATLPELLKETGLLKSNKLPKDYCILFAEYRWKSKEEAVNEIEQPIRSFMDHAYRTEALVRVANYAMICTVEHPFMKLVVEECRRRSHLKRTCDYDVLFITGPDVVSHVYATTDRSFREKNNIILIPFERHNKFIVHHCAGGWRGI